MKIKSSILVVFAFVIGTAAAQAQTQDYPSRPVRLISPFAAGGPTDTLLRLMSEKLTEKWKQPVVVKSKPGAGTMVGANYVARSNPDGYTVGFVIAAFATNPALRTNVPYDMNKDFAYVTQMGYSSGFPLVAHADFPANTLTEVIEQSKKANPALRYTSPGLGTDGHLMGALLASTTGAKLQHVPYNGSAPALVDVLAGRVPLMFDVWVSVKPHVEAGKLKVIALANTKRMPGFDFPTISETVPGLGNDSPIGFVAPAGTPKEILEKLARDIGDAVNAPDVAERMRSFGVEPVRSTPADFEKRMKDVYENAKKVATEANIRIE